MQTEFIFIIIWAAMISMSFWESSAEGRNCWDKNKFGWKVHRGKYVLMTRYHFWIWMMWIFMLLLPLALSNWNIQLLGILISAFLSGQVLEDFFWYVVNPKVRLKEFHTDFSDYYPWIRISRQKIIPWFYVTNTLIALLSWFFLWR